MMRSILFYFHLLVPFSEDSAEDKKAAMRIELDGIAIYAV
jgi:hypothetical protein